MKIRKANMQSGTYTVYIHENKKEEQTLVAIPSLQWSTIIPYEEEKTTLTNRLTEVYQSKLNEEEANHLALKLVQWVSEM
ncbi:MULTISPECIES: YueH family protein [Bacillus]|uniref:YueH family protein n=1 Tax=Bacillus TaxID=1386 RepID=UPI000BB8F620|nr:MULTISPECIES: YueH family protein [Bacillus]